MDAQTVTVTVEGLNRLVRRGFRAPWFSVEQAEDMDRPLEFLVTGHVKKFQRDALRRIRTRDQKYITGAALDELASLGKIQVGRYVVHK